MAKVYLPLLAAMKHHFVNTSLKLYLPNKNDATWRHYMREIINNIFTKCLEYHISEIELNRMEGKKKKLWYNISHFIEPLPLFHYPNLMKCKEVQIEFKGQEYDDFQLIPMDDIYNYLHHSPCEQRSLQIEYNVSTTNKKGQTDTLWKKPVEEIVACLYLLAGRLVKVKKILVC